MSEAKGRTQSQKEATPVAVNMVKLDMALRPPHSGAVYPSPMQSPAQMYNAWI